MEARLPAHLEVSALIRQVEAAGGFGIILGKGDRDAGTIMVVLVENGGNGRVFERMPQADGLRKWHCSLCQTGADSGEIQDFIDRRRRQDPDLWVVELDIAKGERFIGVDPEDS